MLMSGEINMANTAYRFTLTTTELQCAKNDSNV